MAKNPITATEKQMNALKLTSVERSTLFNNFIATAKQWSWVNNFEAGSTVPVIRKLSLEVMFIKFCEFNLDYINKYGIQREFQMFKANETSADKTLLVLTNGLIVPGFYGFNSKGEETVDMSTYECLVDGERTYLPIKSHLVAMTNSNMTKAAIKAIPLFTKETIDELKPLHIVDTARTRAVLNKANRNSIK